jgi:acetylornithine deacetylase/succinyl-diaminopimelate desuccinylase-like protein
MKLIAPFLALTLLAVAPSADQGEPDWAALESETMRHFQALLRFDTSDPPGNERPAGDYLVEALTGAGIAVDVFAREAHRPNVVARLKGSGAKRPLLLMAHTDVVNVDPAKWTHPPFGAVRDGGYVYGRGAVDDKDNVAAALVVMLALKRLAVPLDRDVIFLAEAGEEGSTEFGIEYMVEKHFASIEAEFCLAEGGVVRREGGRAVFAGVQTMEKIPRRIDLTATGTSGHASIPLEANAVVRLASAIEKVARWEAPIRLNETTATYFQRLAVVSPPEKAARYRDVLNPARIAEIDRYFRTHEPLHAALLHTTATPTIADAGYRVNVIPSEAHATIDVRTLPDDDPAEILKLVTETIGDPAVKVAWGARNVRPGGVSRLDSEAFRALERAAADVYGTPTIPAMSTGATDMAYLRARGVQCYGIGPGVDFEDGSKGFGAHSDQERILEAELHRFVRFLWRAVVSLAAAPSAARP